MTEETQIDPPWKAALHKSIADALAARDCAQFGTAVPGGDHEFWTTWHASAAVAMAAVLPHMETAYRTGRMAGASDSAKRLAQKNLELAKELREVRELLKILDGES